jgi:aminopeptidase N
LTHSEAIARAELLSVNAYDIDLDLAGAREDGYFTSTTTVHFTCGDPGAGTFTSSSRHRSSVVLSGKPIDPFGHGNRILLTNLLAETAGRRARSYSNTGEGLHRFTDPEDGGLPTPAGGRRTADLRLFRPPDLKAPIA